MEILGMTINEILIVSAIILILIDIFFNSENRLLVDLPCAQKSVRKDYVGGYGRYFLFSYLLLVWHGDFILKNIISLRKL